MKTITSPVERFPGHVVLHDPIPIDRWAVWERGLRELSGTENTTDNVLKLIPGICAVVAEWHLENWPETVSIETWPATPRLPAMGIVRWLVNEISDVANGDFDPNA